MFDASRVDARSSRRLVMARNASLYDDRRYVLIELGACVRIVDRLAVSQASSHIRVL